MKKSIKILFLIILFILINATNVYGAISFKDTTQSALKGYTIGEFYNMAANMKQSAESLAGTTVEVHMANNREWATVSYFSNSNYGTSGVGENNGVQVGSNLSTNGNITGIMDWGKTLTFTAGVADNHPTSESTDSALTSYNNGKVLIDNMLTNTYIDKVTSLGTQEVAKTGWYSGSNVTVRYRSMASIFLEKADCLDLV